MDKKILLAGMFQPEKFIKKANLVQPIDIMGVTPITLRKKLNKVRPWPILPQLNCAFLPL
ncbi:MAG: hypothetical protein COA80_19380 [Leeuwenhoekiella sp.]|nr:MAG: hypothetical protein COA80_19380 [Leeuwenhoekiella sp.]